jgi:hypothetical protein
MIPPDHSDIEIYAGTDFSSEWEWYADGNGVDFTGCTAAFAMRVCPTDALPLVAVTTTPSPSGSIVLGTAANQNAGIVILNLSAAATASLVYPVAHGDLVITMTDGTKQEFLQIDAFIFGPLYMGPGQASSGGLPAPAGPPGMPGPGPGKTISAALYPVQPADYWLRADTTNNDVTFLLPAAGSGEGDSRTFTWFKGTHNMIVKSPSANMQDPQAPQSLVSQFVTNSGSVTFTWDAAESEWVPT